MTITRKPNPKLLLDPLSIPRSDLQTESQTQRDKEPGPDPQAVSYSSTDIPDIPEAKIRRGTSMLSTQEVYKRRGKKRSKHYDDIKKGLFVEPVAIGLRSKATPDYEVDTLIASDIAGKTEEERRVLVRKLHAARKEAL
jgi:prophage regulatory protein